MMVTVLALSFSYISLFWLCRVIRDPFYFVLIIPFISRLFPGRRDNFLWFPHVCLFIVIPNVITCVCVCGPVFCDSPMEHTHTHTHTYLRLR